MNANKRIVPRPNYERFDIPEGESFEFWRLILQEYSQRSIRDQSIQLLDNNPIKAIFNREDPS